MDIIEVTEYSPEVHEAIDRLLPQLSKSAKPLGVTEIQNVISSDAVHLLVAREDNEYFGTLSLVIFPIITGTRAWIEDVVVSENARGKGVGKRLTSKAIEIATEFGAKTVDLTSRPSREVANGLYRAVGFEIRETNVYRLSTDGNQ